MIIGKKIYTMGHSNLSLKKFVKALKENSVEIIVDVRRFPKSKTIHFNKSCLMKILADVSIEYAHYLGLGGYRAGGYEKYMTTSYWKKSFERLQKLAKRKTVCLLCLEPDYRYCHRRFIAEELAKIGWKVIHIKP
ncbi:MAG: DUF488 domain-containing protein [Candidatus Thermoplasmatota archaeon]